MWLRQLLLCLTLFNAGCFADGETSCLFVLLSHLFVDILHFLVVW